MSVSEGMDVDRVRSIAAELGGSSERLRTVRGIGNGSLAVLAGAWEGTDLGVFSAGWRDGSGSLETAALALQRVREELLRQVDEQVAGSGGGGAGESGSEVPDRPRRDGRDVMDEHVKRLRDLVGFGGGGDSDGDGGGGWGLPNPLDAIGEAWDRGTDAVGDLWDEGARAAEAGWDWGLDRGREAFEWGRDRAEDGLEWAGDRALELGRVAHDFWDDEIVSRWDAGVEAAQRLGPSITNFGEQFTQVFTDGRWPRFHEVVASGTLLAGRTVGLMANIATGDDHQIFDSGEGVVTDTDRIAADPNEPGRIPSDLNALMDIQSSTYDLDKSADDNRHVRVTEVRQPDGSSAYIVTVPGTNGLTDFPDSITGGDEAFDNTSNLELQAGQRSASMEAVMAAMDEAGIPPDAPVLMQGHSQGGMVTAELLQDPEFTDQYNVTHMITEGSPNDSRTIPGDVRTLAIEHTNDPVPKVDLGDAYAGPPVAIPTPGPLPPVVLPMTPIPNFDPALAGSGDHVTQVRLDPGPGVDALSGGVNDRGAHDYVDYANTVERELESGNPDLTAYAADEGLRVFLTDDPSQVVITEYETGRR